MALSNTMIKNIVAEVESLLKDVTSDDVRLGFQLNAGVKYDFSPLDRLHQLKTYDAVSWNYRPSIGELTINMRRRPKIDIFRDMRYLEGGE